MKKTFYFLSVCALVFTMAACGAKGDANVKKLSQFVEENNESGAGESVLYACTWAGNQMESVVYDNPFGDVLDYNAQLTYDEGRVSVIDDNRFVTKLSYSDGRLAQIDQFSHDGVHLHQYVFNYTSDDCAEITHNSMSHEAIQWVEAIVYDKRDSLGNEVRYEMPEDTSLHLSAECKCRWENENLVSISCNYVEAGFTAESTLEYDDKVNPFYQQCVGFNRLDAVMVELSMGENHLGFSKNNVTKARVTLEMGANHSDTISRVFVYEYEGDYPVRVTFGQDGPSYRYVYEQ